MISIVFSAVVCSTPIVLETVDVGKIIRDRQVSISSHRCAEEYPHTPCLARLYIYSPNKFAAVCGKEIKDEEHI